MNGTTNAGRIVERNCARVGARIHIMKLSCSDEAVYAKFVDIYITFRPTTDVGFGLSSCHTHDSPFPTPAALLYSSLQGCADALQYMRARVCVCVCWREREREIERDW